MTQRKVRRLQIHKADPYSVGTLPPADMRGKHHNKPNKIPEEMKDKIRNHIRTYLASHPSVEWKGSAGQTVNIKHMWFDCIKKYEPRQHEMVQIGLKYSGQLNEYLYRQIFNTEFKPHLEALKGCVTLGHHSGAE